MNAQGRTFLITTHDRAVAEAVAHRIVTIVDGSIERIEQGGSS
jgi:ABC-type ATPase involved in cell division